VEQISGESRTRSGLEYSQSINSAKIECSVMLVLSRERRFSAEDQFDATGEKAKDEEVGEQECGRIPTSALKTEKLVKRKDSVLGPGKTAPNFSLNSNRTRRYPERFPGQL